MTAGVIHLTKKQRIIMTPLLKGVVNSDGVTVDWLDIDQLLEAITYETTKDSMQFSIRYLIKKGLLEKCETELRRGRKRRVIKPTNLAFDRLTTMRRAQPKYYENDDIVEYN